MTCGSAGVVVPSLDGGMCFRSRVGVRRSDERLLESVRVAVGGESVRGVPED